MHGPPKTKTRLESVGAENQTRHPEGCSDTLAEGRSQHSGKSLTAQAERRAALQWRGAHGYLCRGGFVVLFYGEGCGWTAELSEPRKWRPGCVAVSENGLCFDATGGNYQDGAAAWTARTAPDLDDVQREIVDAWFALPEAQQNAVAGNFFPELLTPKCSLCGGRGGDRVNPSDPCSMCGKERGA